MPYSVYLVVPAVVGGLLVAGAMFLLTRGRLSGRNAKLAAATAGLAWALGWYFTALMVLFGVAVAAAGYGFARLFIRAEQAMVAAFGAYVVFMGGAGYVLYVGLNGMG
ncbi:hypothetical protein [Amycolatopsis echigonensis]|uniref:Uncharacterized protein n=1 Tax=Amycolatopsis echigonensis TaxID=2576905 RepID=A0A2N3WVS5_9PSEU|nr:MULTISPECIES: hypothetical protein [Amycolatopsis]MBB2505344.1 hypothetical protein [Amycolatopsis echigonensis]PKV97960.1 hypothetical protein ATK30_8963 [Amycolatopsis niigatensis]